MNRDFDDHSTSDPVEQKLSMAKDALVGFIDLLYSHIGNGFCPDLGLSRFPDSPQDGCDANSIEDIKILNDEYYIYLVGDVVDPEDNPGEIQKLEADGGSTPLLEGINTAINMFNPADNLKMIVLLSDGRHNCPSTDIDPNNLLEITNNLNGIKLYTIGFGATSLIPDALYEYLITDDQAGKHYNINTDIFDKNNNDISYVPGTSSSWNAKTALAATYANILEEGFDQLNLTIDPVDIINQGKTKQILVPVTQFDNKVCFYVSWVTPKINNLNVKVFTPDGNELSLNQAGIKVTRRKSHTIITVSKEILNQERMIGDWTLEIVNSNFSKTPEHYQYTVINSSKKLILNTWFDKSKYFTGDEMKIYLELLVDNKRLTPLDNIFVKGSGPDEGFGSWLASKKVTWDQLEKMKQTQLEEFMKWEMGQPKFKELNKEQKQRYQEALRKKFTGNMDPINLRAQVLMKEYDMKYPHRIMINGLEFNDEGKAGDEKADDGIYTTMRKSLAKEGTYQFYFTVIDTSKGNNIKRESQLQKYVSVKVKPRKFVKDIIRIDTVLKGKSVYDLTLNLQDKYGNIPTPDALINIKLNLDNGELIGHIQTNPDGTFTQMVSLPENVKPRQVKMTINVYEQVGEQRLKPLIPNWRYIIIGIVILIIIGLVKRKKWQQLYRSA